MSVSTVVERFASDDDAPLLFYSGHHAVPADSPDPELPDEAAAPFADPLL